MYTQRSFRVDDQELLLAFIRRYSFATLISHADDETHISHVPVLVETAEDTLVLTGHLASANPHVQQINGRKATAIFHGPDSYISPSWYADSGEVPTWNYAVVHAVGLATTFTNATDLSPLVDRMTAVYEARYEGGWDGQLPYGYRSSQLKHITGFRLEVEGLTGKFKLGQNRSAEDQDRMLAHLEAADSEDSRALASFIRELRQAGLTAT